MASSLAVTLVTLRAAPLRPSLRIAPAYRLRSPRSKIARLQPSSPPFIDLGGGIMNHRAHRRHVATGARDHSSTGDRGAKERRRSCPEIPRARPSDLEARAARCRCPETAQCDLLEPPGKKRRCCYRPRTVPFSPIVSTLAAPNARASMGKGKGVLYHIRPPRSRLSQGDQLTRRPRRELRSVQPSVLQLQTTLALLVALALVLVSRGAHGNLIAVGRGDRAGWVREVAA